jgi:hypothetical protein
MKRPLGWVWVALFGATFTFHVTGCSLIGLGAGAAYDAANRDVRAQSPGRIVKLHPGDAMILDLDDGSRVDGVYLRPGRIPERSYVRFYNEWRAKDPRAEGFPRIGERVTVDNPSSVVGRGQGMFVGFGLEGIEVESSNGERRVIPVSEDGSLLGSNKSRVSMERVRQLAIERALPLSTTLEIRTGDDVRTILLNEVVLIHAPNHPNGARTGFAIGLAVDVLVVIVAIAAEPGAPNTGCDPGYTGYGWGW